MKCLMMTFFILLTAAGVCTLQGCGKKSAPQSTCKAETFPPSYDK